MRQDHEPEPPPVQQGVPPIHQPFPTQPQPQQDDVIHRLVPTRNGAALAAYYCGVFSLVCFIGILLAFVAIGAGIKGIQVHNQDPSRRGLFHAIAGIVLGCLSLVAHAVAIFFSSGCKGIEPQSRICTSANKPKSSIKRRGGSAGVSPEALSKDYYKTLGLKQDADPGEVRAAYRRLARKLHPDVNKSPDAGERMSELNEAYAVLGDPERRAAYDAKRRRVATIQTPKRATLNVVVEPMYAVCDFRSPLYAVAVSPSGRTVAVGSFDNRVRIVRARDGETLGEVSLPGGAIEAIRWIGNDAFVAAGASEKTFSAWFVRDGVATRWKGKRAEWVSRLDISPDGKRLALGSVHRTLMVVDAKTGAQQFIRRRHRDAISAVRYSPDGSLLASGANDHRVVLYEAKHGLEIADFGPFPTAISSIAINSESTLLAVALIDHGIRVIRLRDGVVIASLRAHSRPIESIEFHPTRNLLASAARDGTVRLWETSSEAASLVVAHLDSPMKAVAFSPSGNRLFAGGLDRKLRVWHVAPKRTSARERRRHNR